jgi:hypothetical protein
MGNSTVKGPKTDKIIKSDTNNFLSYSCCEMQGWRNTMVGIVNIGRRYNLSA